MDREALAASLAELVLGEELLQRLGPAVNSGRSILLYGTPGNGKTRIAEAVGRAFGDAIHIPYCLEVDGQIIELFDDAVHRQAEDGGAAMPTPTVGAADARWVRTRRPVLIAGGELTLDMLDMTFNPHERFYEAPLQLKATGGVLVIDDFGRQRTPPQAILDRWIVPLERGIDYLTLHTGRKFPVPFDALVVFATNLRPRDLSDEAVLRRLHYKIEIPPPDEAQYRTIFAGLCRRIGIDLPDDVLPFLFEEFYGREGAPLAGYHASYLVEQVAAMCQYEGVPVRIDKERLRLALQNLHAT